MEIQDISFLIPSSRWGFYDFLKDFQSGITGLVVGGLGFFGVMKTLKGNARLAREARAETV
jgi:hypothetical protein